jgi:hypothetical protein
MRDSFNKEQKEKLLQLVRQAVLQDGELRGKFQVGDKFRFIRDRLNTLLANLEEGLAELQQKVEKKSDTITENETLVYVYLYNAQGIVLQTWNKMLIASVLNEYSVNRPIYSDKDHIDAFIRSKPNKVQHAYLTIAVPKQAVTVSASDSSKDGMGNPLVKVKEGSLQFNRLLAFSHGGHEYAVGASGELVKKKENLND